MSHIMVTGWPPRFWRQWRARREHKRLVAEMRSNWRWIADYKEEVVKGGETLYVGGAYALEENELGERRIRVIWRAYDHYKFGSPKYRDCQVWAAKGKARAVPRKELA